MNILKPMFTVIIPTYARPQQLEMCLEGLGQLDYPREAFEVIVVDDGSPDPVAKVASLFRSILPLRCIRQANRGPAAARNAGAKAAGGEYLAFTDDDCRPDRGWLRGLEHAFAEEPHGLVGGAVVNALADNPFSTTTQAIMEAVCEYYDRHPDRKRFFSTSNLAVSTERFHELGGFCEAFPLAAGEDYDFCDRWQQHGRAIRRAPAAIVWHAHALTLAGFCRQHFTFGRGLLRFRTRAARRAGRTLRSEPLAFYLHLLAYPLRQWSGWRGWLYCGLVMLSQAATLAGACYEVLSAGFSTVWKHDTPASRGETT